MHDEYPVISFIGGGNMASAIIGGLRQQGWPPGSIVVLEPLEPTRNLLKSRFGVRAIRAPGTELSASRVFVWAVKPQVFQEAVRSSRPYAGEALHLSVVAGVPSSSINAWLGGNARVVRAMPNTPALIGRGITGLYASGGVEAAERVLVERLISTIGELLWVRSEVHLDVVTALSGSGPAYVFLLLEAMTQAGTELGLSRDDALRLGACTFAGAAEMVRQSTEPPDLLRERVTSPGGTTHAAISLLQKEAVPDAMIRAIHAAHRRAAELGIEFGATGSRG